MNSAQLLDELQAVDQELDRRHDRLAVIADRLGDDATLVGLRGQSAELQGRIEEIAAAQQELESIIAPFTGKIDRAEGKLYGGAVKSPRELADLQADVAQLKRQRAGQEERLLEVLDEMENLQISRQTVGEELQERERAWEEEQSAMAKEQGVLNGQVKRISKTRNGITKRVPPVDLVLYEQVRRGHGGRAVSRVLQNRCESCHIALATHQLQQVRTSSSLVRCGSCGLILLAA